jgi:hypothetical protein
VRAERALRFLRKLEGRLTVQSRDYPLMNRERATLFIAACEAATMALC